MRKLNVNYSHFTVDVFYRSQNAIHPASSDYFYFLAFPTTLTLCGIFSQAVKFVLCLEHRGHLKFGVTSRLEIILTRRMDFCEE